MHGERRCIDYSSARLDGCEGGAREQAFLVEAVKQNRRSSVRQFFDEHAADLLASPDAAAWQRWLALPYMKHPWEHHHFKARLAWPPLLPSSQCRCATVRQHAAAQV